MNTWRATRDRSLDGPLPAIEVVPIPEGQVEVGQVWASNDSRDRRNGWRQERIVVEVSTRHDRAFARLYSLPGKRHQATSTNGVTDGLIDRHRYVRPATVSELIDRGLDWSL